MEPVSDSLAPVSAKDQPQALASVNGKILPLHEAMIPANDRGFLFGDAVYEVIRVYRGHPWMFDEHFERLASSLSAVRIEGMDLARLKSRVLDLVRQGGFGEAIIYIQVTRGCGDRKHAPPPGLVPLEFFYVKQFDDPYAELRQRGGHAITYPDLRWRRCDIKSTNLLGNVLAMQAAAEANCCEALLFRHDGTLTEGTHTTLFAVHDGVVFTTPQGNSILPGITGQILYRLTEKLGISLEERLLHRSQFNEFDELFVTGTTSEVLPIIAVDQVPIRDGVPGPITRQLQQAYAHRVQEFLAEAASSQV